MWRYWRSGVPAPESNSLVQKLYALTDGRSNDLLFRMLDSRRSESGIPFQGETVSQVLNVDGTADREAVVRSLREDGAVVIPPRLKSEAVQNLYQLARSCQLKTTDYAPLEGITASGTATETPIASYGTSDGIDPSRPVHSVYSVPRELLLASADLQRLLCDPYLLEIARRYLGVFPVVTKPDMWWDTDCLPTGLRPRPFHVDSGCLRWLKVGVNLTDTTEETPHFVYVKGSHNPNKATRPLTKRLASRMNLSDTEVREICPERVMHLTGPAGSIILADTRGIHKGEIALRGHRLVLYFGLEGSAFNNVDKPIPLPQVGEDLAKAMAARPFSYQFFRKIDKSAN